MNLERPQDQSHPPRPDTPAPRRRSRRDTDRAGAPRRPDERPGPHIPGATVELEPHLRGRESELTAIGEHLDRLLSGAGTVVVIEGRAGMGKSRLLSEVATMAERLSMRVGRGVADPGDTIVQLAPLMEALLEGPTPIFERDALRTARTSPEERYWLLQDIEALLERAALDSPIVICLDDLQWTDAGTAAALRNLPRRLSTVPVGWFIAARPGPGSPEFRRLTDHLERSGAHKIGLGPLDETAVARIAADVLLADPDGALLDMAEHAGGNPFLLVEFLRGLREEDLVRVHAGRAELVQARVPKRVSESMRRRLERASDTARRLGTVAASLGRRFSLDELAAMLDVAPSNLLMPLEELAHANVLVDCDGKLAFLHDLTREAVRSSVPVSVRRALDRQAAMVLLAGGACPVEVAMQLVASAEPGDDIAITTLLNAAEALGTTDPGAAADLGRRALELAPPNHPLRAALVSGTAVWLHAAGRGEEAKVFADTALRQVLPPAQEAVVRLGIASMFSISPDVRAESCRKALALSGLPPEIRTHQLALLVHNLVTAGRVAEAWAAFDDARTGLRGSGDIRVQFILELAESALQYDRGRFGHSLALVEAALRTGTHARDETRAHLARQWHCDVLSTVDRLEESLALSHDNVAEAQRHRQGWALHIFETGHARQLLQLGSLADAAAVLRERYCDDSAQEIVMALDAAGVVSLGRAALHLGDEGCSRQVAQLARALLDRGVPSVRRHAAWILALQAMARGDPAAAHQCLCTHGEQERLSIVPLFPMDVSDAARLVHIALAVKDEELALVACAGAQLRAELNPEVASLAAAAAHTRGLVHHDPVELSKAVALFEGGLRPLPLAAALEDLGILAAESGETKRAVDAFSHSLVVFAEAGATSDARRMRGRLRALGVRRRLVTAQCPESGWTALTASELAVARLVAEGLTNREVAVRLSVSPHTINGQLRSVFTKLDVNCRVQLTRLANLQVFTPESGTRSVSGR